MAHAQRWIDMRAFSASEAVPEEGVRAVPAPDLHVRPFYKSVFMTN